MVGPRLSDNHPALRAPKIRVEVPIVQGLTVKNLLKAGFFQSRNGITLTEDAGSQSQSQHECTPHSDG
jgi:hypothetical protein